MAEEKNFWEDVEKGGVWGKQGWGKVCVCCCAFCVKVKADV